MSYAPLCACNEGFQQVENKCVVISTTSTTTTTLIPTTTTSVTCGDQGLVQNSIGDCIACYGPIETPLSSEFCTCSENAELSDFAPLCQCKTGFYLEDTGRFSIFPRYFIKDFFILLKGT